MSSPQWKTELKAAACGMTAERWVHAKAQAVLARGRGRRRVWADADKKLAAWGTVPDQLSLFDE